MGKYNVLCLTNVYLQYDSKLLMHSHENMKNNLGYKKSHGKK